jgi:glutathione S-transferase
MKLFYSTNSPYARKCRVVTLEKGLADQVEFVLADPNTNPLATVPALAGENGFTLCESPVICEYLDSLAKENPLFPARGKARFESLALAALADGVMDAAVSCVLESRKPEDKRTPEWVIRKENAIRRAIADIDARVSGQKALCIGTINAAVALAYVNFRLAHLGWGGDHPDLAKWLDSFSQRSSMAATRPAA